MLFRIDTGSVLGPVWPTGPLILRTNWHNKGNANTFSRKGWNSRLILVEYSDGNHRECKKYTTGRPGNRFSKTHLCGLFYASQSLVQVCGFRRKVRRRQVMISSRRVAS